jgi:AMP nucleosidase
MDLLTALQPKGALFLGKCGGLKQSTEIGHFILPIGATTKYWSYAIFRG